MKNRFLRILSAVLTASMLFTQAAMATDDDSVTAFEEGMTPVSDASVETETAPSEQGAPDVMIDGVIDSQEAVYTSLAENVVVEADIPDNDELLTEYVSRLFYGSSEASLYSSVGHTGGSKLSGDERVAYDALTEIFKDIASGDRTSTVIAVGGVANTSSGTSYPDVEADFTGTWADFDFGILIDALLSDMPYEMYWYDKTTGCHLSGYTSGGVICQLIFSFTVAGNYRGDNIYTVNASTARTAAAAVENVWDIIDAYESKDDYNKLVGYRDEICALVTYDHNAASNGNYAVNNDPWQLVDVFDGDSSTNVVCEGYAKAFKYLCDMSEFEDSDIACYIATGTMLSSSSSGGHMWNIVTMDDGKNYIADVTNSDSGTIGQNGGLFLDGAPISQRTVTSTSSSGVQTTKTVDCYVFTINGRDIVFIYDDDTTGLWGTGAGSILTLAETDYVYSPDQTYVASGTCGDELTWTLDSEGVLTISGTGAMYNYTFATVPWANYRSSIVKAVVGDGVTSISDYAFNNCTALAEISLADTVETIGDYVFVSCRALARLELPKALTSIGRGTFNQCRILEGLHIPANVSNIDAPVNFGCYEVAEITVDDNNEYYTSENGVLFNKDMTELVWYPAGSTVTSYSIPDTVEIIVSQAFAMADSLESIVIPEGVSVIKDSAFAYCRALTELTIPASVYSIGYGAARGCYALTDIYVADDNESYVSVDGVLFTADMSQLIQYPAGKTVSEYAVPDGVKTIGTYAFEQIKQLTRVEIPESVESLGTNAFLSCSALLSVEFTEGIKTISSSAFQDCRNLSEITFPASLKTIGMRAFYNCKGLKKVVILSPNAAFKDNTVFQGATSVTLYGYADSTAQAYANTNSLPFNILGTAGDILTASPVIDGVLDASYLASLALTDLGTAENAYGTSWPGNASADVYFLYDDEYLYICALVEDDDVLTKGEAFATGSNPYKNDTIEFRLSLDGTSDTIKVSVDAYGYACFGLPADYSVLDYSEIRYATTYTGTSYVVEVAIPHTNENFDMLSAGMLGFTYQLNDIDADGKHYNHTTSFFGEAVKTPIFYFLSDQSAGELAAEGTCGDELTWTLSHDGVLTISGNGEMYDYSSGGAPWYSHAEDITSIVVENGVTSVGNSAFYMCMAVEAVYLPTSLERIGNSAFLHVNIPEVIELPKGLVSIGSSAFAYCEGLLTVKVPASVTSIGAGAFRGCNALTEIIVVADNTDYVGVDGVLYTSDMEILVQCPAGKEMTEFVIPDGVAFIGASAFERCKMASVYLPASVNSIDSTAFINNTNLVAFAVSEDNEVYASDELGVLFNKDMTTLIRFPEASAQLWYEIPDSVMTVAVRAFRNNRFICTLVVPNSVKTIEAYAFDHANQLISVLIDDGLESINAYAFRNCGLLSEVVIPDSVTFIADSAFYSCNYMYIYCNVGNTAYNYAVEFGKNIVPYVPSLTVKYGTAKVDGVLDETYADSLTLTDLGTAENAYKTAWPGTASADVSFLYDDTYIYICAVVTDDDVLTKGEAFAMGSNPYQNDNIEFRIATNNLHNTIKVAVDAYGYACYGLAGNYDLLDYSTVEYATAHTDTGYIVEVAIPHTTEKLNLIGDGMLGFTYQLNDIDANGKHYNHTTSFYGENAKTPVFYMLDEPEEEVLGDATGDGQTNPIDLAYLQRYLAGWSGYDETKVNIAALDLNLDGKVNPMDAAVLARHIAKWIGYETLPYKTK